MPLTIDVWEDREVRATEARRVMYANRAKRFAQEFAAAIADARYAKGLTQQDVAYIIGVTKSAVCALESGQTVPLLTTACRAANAVGLSMTALMKRLSEENQ